MLSRLSFTAARCMPSSSSSIRVVAYGSAGATRVAAPAALTCMGATRHFSLGGSSEKKPVRVAVTGAAGNIVCPLYVLALITFITTMTLITRITTTPSNPCITLVLLCLHHSSVKYKQTVLHQTFKHYPITQHAPRSTRIAHAHHTHYM